MFERRKIREMSNFDISIIVTTRNEEKHLADCLRSIKEQNYPRNKLEIIVVDNNSTDKTKEIAARFTSLIFNYGPERSAQRNSGVARSTGRYILYLDADMTLRPEVLRECYNKCEKEGWVGAYIPEKIIGRGFWIKVRNFERAFYNETVVDCVRFVSREAFEKIAGFDEDLNGPEDWDFDRRIRALGPTGIIESCLYHDEGRFRLIRYAAKKRYYARGFARYIEKWGKDDPVIRKQFGIFYRYLGVFIAAGRWKRLLAHPLLALGMYLLRLAIGIVYISSRFGKQ